MSAREDLLGRTEKLLEMEFGPVDLRDAVYDFDPMTDYYAGEFGRGLRKIIFSLEETIPAEKLVEVKIRTNEIEEELAREFAPGEAKPPRVVNIDPGYLNHSKVVLATTKDHSHRLYMGRGIFEEVTLNYRRVPGEYQAHAWTFRDYQMPGRIAFFGRVRELYREGIKRDS